MGKIVNDTHIVGERGVIRFHDYCNTHFPYICFREIVRNDFGVDGEVELVRVNDEGKKEITGELLKVQIKSSFGTGYIKKKRDGSFSFSAKKVDLEYWSKYSLDVLLIIYDDESESLYAKKIRQEDYLGAKKKSYPILFGDENKLERGKNDFVQRFSADFKSRISYDAPEILTTNLLFVKQHPRRLYVYDSKFSRKKELFEELQDQNEAPYFVLYNKKIITGHAIAKRFDKFCKCAVINPDEPAVVSYDDIVKTAANRRNLVELLNQMLKDFLHRKGIFFNKDYKRFYFSKPKDGAGRTIEKTSIKTGKVSTKKVVTYHEYGKDKFYKHVAFEMDFIFTEGDIFIILNPKYLFTIDGKETLNPVKITKYTNFLTANEWNDQVQDQLYVVLNFLTNSAGGVEVITLDDLKFHITKLIHQDVRFGIPSDIPANRGSAKREREDREAAERSKQTSLFS